VISGHMGSYQSPADPLFFAHHVFVDHAWYAWQKYYQDSPESASCGSCDTLQDFGETVAQDYVGRYSSEHDCVQYPVDEPRICLAYQMASSTSTSRKVGVPSETSNIDSCDALMAQLDAGECSDDDLAEITVIDSCLQHEETNRILAGEWVNNMVNSGHGHSMSDSDVQESITKAWARFRKHKTRPATSPVENRTCIACEFKCRGKTSTTYVDMSVKHGNGTCADGNGNNFDSWKGDAFTYATCADQCSALSSCIGFDLTQPGGQCRIRFSDGNLPDQNPGPFQRSWASSIGVGPIAGVKTQDLDRKCYAKHQHVS